MTRTISANGLAFIIKEEGFRATWYLDGGGYSIGYGYSETLMRKLFGLDRSNLERLERPQADVMLPTIIREEFAPCVARSVRVPLTQGQYDALISWMYNVGCPAAQGSTLIRKLNAGDVQAAAAEFARWNKSQGRVLPGLVARRGREAALFMSGVPARGGVPTAPYEVKYAGIDWLALLLAAGAITYIVRRGNAQ